MKPFRKRIVAVVVVLGIGAILWQTVFRGNGIDGALVVSGTVEATESHLGFQVPGRIDRVSVREGDSVALGQELATLDRTEALARRDQAMAQIAAAAATLAEMQNGFRPEEVAQAQGAVNAAEARLADAVRDRERTERLQGGGAVSLEALDKARMAETLAQSEFARASDQLTLVRAGPRAERIAAQRAQLQAAEAALRVVDATLENMTITARSAGVVTERHREPGETAMAGGAVLSIMDPSDRWVRIFVPEDRIGAVQLHQPARISSDTYEGRSYDGEVTFIASQAEFTPKNVQTPEERVKLVYAVKIRITGDPGFELKPGMPADVRLDLGQG